MGQRTHLKHTQAEGKEMTLPEDAYRHPDPIKHKYISFAKSGVRIAAGFALAFGMVWSAGGLLVLAEVLGIAEEMV